MRVLCVTQGLEVTPTRKVNPQFFWLFGPHFKCQPYQWSHRCSKFVLERSTFRGLSQRTVTVVGEKLLLNVTGLESHVVVQRTTKGGGSNFSNFHSASHNRHNEASINFFPNTSQHKSSRGEEARKGKWKSGWRPGQRKQDDPANLDRNTLWDMCIISWPEIHYETLCVLLVGQEYSQR